MLYQQGKSILLYLSFVYSEFLQYKDRLTEDYFSVSISLNFLSRVQALHARDL